jgi:EF-hand domain pair/EF hand
VTDALVAAFDDTADGEGEESSVDLDQFIHLYRFLSAMSALFLEADTDQSGSLDSSEVATLLNKELDGMNVSLEKDLIVHLVGLLEKTKEAEEGEAEGTEEGRGLGLDQFVLLRLLIGQAHSAFVAAGLDGEGCLTVDNAVKSVQQQTGKTDSAQEEDVRALFAEFDVDGDKKLSWPEYLRIAFSMIAE